MDKLYHLDYIKAYLTEEQINRYEELLGDMDGFKLDIDGKIEAAMKFLKEEGLLETYKEGLSEEQLELLFPSDQKPEKTLKDLLAEKTSAGKMRLVLESGEKLEFGQNGSQEKLLEKYGTWAVSSIESKHTYLDSWTEISIKEPSEALQESKSGREKEAQEQKSFAPKKKIMRL